MEGWLLMGATGTYTYRFIGGRKRINAQRQRAAWLRRAQVRELLKAGESKAAIARELKVSATTISNDVKQIITVSSLVTCPLCGHETFAASPEAVAKILAPASILSNPRATRPQN